MTKSLKKPRAHYQWMGATVVTTQSLSSGVAVIPAGSRGVVEGAKRGLSVVFDACPCCGVQLRLTRIPLLRHRASLRRSSTRQIRSETFLTLPDGNTLSVRKVCSLLIV